MDMELRKRPSTSLSGSGDATSSSRSSSPESKGAKIDRNFTRCIISSIFVVLLALTLPLVFRKQLQEPLEYILDGLGLESRLHAVVLDAGSTGSRVLAFTFRRDLLNGSQLTLEDELWKQVKPGLSSFATEPHKAGDSIQELIKAAKGRIPSKNS